MLYVTIIKYNNHIFDCFKHTFTNYTGATSKHISPIHDGNLKSSKIPPSIDFSSPAAFYISKTTEVSFITPNLREHDINYDVFTNPFIHHQCIIK